MLNIGNEIWRRPLKMTWRLQFLLHFHDSKKVQRYAWKRRKNLLKNTLILLLYQYWYEMFGDNCRVRRFLLWKKLWHIKAEKPQAVVKRLFISYFMKNFLLIIRRFRLLFNSIVYCEMQGLIWGENMWCVARFGTIYTI